LSQHFLTMIHISPKDFEKIVWEAVDALPETIRSRINNLEMQVEVAPTLEDIEDMDDDEALFGLYEGTPLTERDGSYDMALPDLITIFQTAHEEECDTLDELKAEVARTVKHELAHHFGISDERLDELGAY